VFHTIRFNALKKQKHEPEGNGVLHQLSNVRDELLKGQAENGFCVLCLARGHRDQKFDAEDTTMR
jgi:hypothetical protein